MSISRISFKQAVAAVLLSCAGVLGPSVFSMDAGAATVVYSQAPNSTFADVSAVANIPGDPGFTWTLDQDEQAWAYFIVPTNASFNRITWYGSNADGSFAVDFYATTCFSCGAQLVGTDGTFNNSLLPNPGPYSQAQVHKTLLSGNFYSYYIDLTSPVALSQNGAYAISVVNNYSAAPFLWEGSNTGSNTHVDFVIGQAMFLPAPGNLAFTLTNTAAAAVPEPETYAMLLAGLGLLGLTARRRKQTAI